MPIISRVGRNHPKVRLLIGLIYFILIAGGVTMIYPLGLMISGSLRGTMDQYEIELIPGYLVDEELFFQRYVESKYSGVAGSFLTDINRAWNQNFLNWKEVKAPPSLPTELLNDFDAFRRKSDFPSYAYAMGHVGNAAWNFMRFKSELIKESQGDISRLDDILGVNFKNWNDVRPRQLIPARLAVQPDGVISRSEAFKLKVPVEDRAIFNVDNEWGARGLKSIYKGSLAEYNKKTGRQIKSWSEVRVSRTAPENEIDRKDWEYFIRQRLPFCFLKLEPSLRGDYQKYLEAIYAPKGGLPALNKAYGTQYTAFQQVDLPNLAKVMGDQFKDLNDFIKGLNPKLPQADLSKLSVDSPATRFSDFVKEKFAGDIEKMQKAYQVNWKSFDEIPFPIAQIDWRDFQNQKSKLRWDFVTRNYAYVIDFLARHGNAVLNTFTLCLLMIGSALIFNPLAAYALSRFGLPSTYKILLFFMVTVALPAEVLMIPNFLQLKQFGLLNSYAALILPGLVSGYSIFLLKGFFDSLPKELYEAAVIDGASEFRIFWSVTLPLSRPILAVMALSAFTAAYGTFLFALMICPEEKMWTIMVYLYQLQQNSGSQSINMAAYCLAAIPTLLVFTFCQRIIMRGIVVPVEK